MAKPARSLTIDWDGLDKLSPVDLVALYNNVMSELVPATYAQKMSCWQELINRLKRLELLEQKKVIISPHTMEVSN